MIDGKLQIFFVFLRQLRLSHDHIRDCPHHVTSQISWFLHLAIHIILTYQNKETLNFFEESIELHPTWEYRITAYIQNIQIVLKTYYRWHTFLFNDESERTILNDRCAASFDLREH